MEETEKRRRDDRRLEGYCGEGSKDENRRREQQDRDSYVKDRGMIEVSGILVRRRNQEDDVKKCDKEMLNIFPDKLAMIYFFTHSYKLGDSWRLKYSIKLVVSFVYHIIELR